MAVTLSARAGGRLVSRFTYYEPGKVAVIDTTGYTAKLEIRSNRPPYRIMLSTTAWVESTPGEDPPPGTLFVQLDPGVWEMRLGRTVTRSLPPVSSFELELMSDTDVEDVVPLASGVVRITPEVVADVVTTA